jgi:hypothetical protein
MKHADDGDNEGCQSGSDGDEGFRKVRGAVGIHRARAARNDEKGEGQTTQQEEEGD